MNAIWDARKRGRVQREQKKAIARPRKASVRRKAVELLPCLLRGATIGKLRCNCKNKPEVMLCSVFTHCIAEPLTNPWDGPIVFADGIKSESNFLPWHPPSDPAKPVDREPLAGVPRIAVCRLCEARQSPEVPPAWSPPRAPDATVEARRAICGACEAREQCRKPIDRPESLELALESCPNGLWRAAS